MSPESFYTNHPAGEEEYVSPEKELSIIVEQQANYKGNWTQLLHERVKNPVTRQKFLDMKAEFPTEETRDKDVEMGKFEKHVDVPQDVYQLTIDNYIKNIENVFSSTQYIQSQESAESGYNPHNPESLGVSDGYGDTGVVFKDATSKGKRLNPDQKTLIEAHEKAHGLFMELTKGEKNFILSPFDAGKINSRYKAKADEVLARMSQLKNYFGFAGGEKFTFEHLKYAKEHYVQDVGMDNSVTNLIESIDDVDTFLKVINTIAC